MNDIKILSTFVSYTNILIIDNNNELWIMGNNNYRKTGMGTKNKHIYMPIKINISLGKNESVENFYCYDKIAVIYTTLGNLYVSNFDDSTTYNKTYDYDNERNYSGEQLSDVETDEESNDDKKHFPVEWEQVKSMVGGDDAENEEE